MYRLQERRPSDAVRATVFIFVTGARKYPVTLIWIQVALNALTVGRPNVELQDDSRYFLFRPYCMMLHRESQTADAKILSIDITDHGSR